MTDFDWKMVEIIAAVIVSAIVSAITSHLSVKQDLKKVPFEIEKIYADNLQQKRIELYPACYKLLSEFNKMIYARQVDETYIRSWLKKMLELDNTVSLFFSGTTANFAYEFYRNLIGVLEKHFEKEGAKPNEFYGDLLNLKIEEFETCLKQDIGVYIVEYDAIKGLKIVNYEDVDKMNQRNEQN